MSGIDQFPGILQAAEAGIDPEIIAREISGGIQARIIAAAAAGIEDRGQPDGVHPQAFDIRQGPDDALQIAVMMGRSVAGVKIARRIAVDEGGDHYLVDPQLLKGLAVGTVRQHRGLCVHQADARERHHNQQQSCFQPTLIDAVTVQPTKYTKYTK